MKKILLLSASYEPLSVISFEKAITGLYKGTLETVESYPNAYIRSPSVTLPFPSVVRYKTYHNHKLNNTVKLTKMNIYLRDKGCVYCDKTIPFHQATIDHLIPRVKGGQNAFENLAVACYRCNQKKMDLTPAEAGLSLKKPLKAPTFRECLVNYIKVFEKNLAPQWEKYLFQ